MIDELPRSFPKVLKLMDRLLGDEEQYSFSQDIHRTRCTLSISAENYPHHPGLAWHTPGESWCPPDVESLESFIELLLEFSRRRRRGERMSLDQPTDFNNDAAAATAAAADDDDGGIGDKEASMALAYGPRMVSS